MQNASLRQPPMTATKAYGAGIGALIGTMLGGIADTWLSTRIGPEWSTAIWTILNVLGGAAGAWVAPRNVEKR